MSEYPKETTSSSLANSNIESPSPSCENIMWMPCHAMMIVANDRNRRWPKRRNSGSYVSNKLEIACWMVGSKLTSMKVSAIALRLPPGPERIAGSGHERFRRGTAVAPRNDLHRQRGRVRVTGSLAVDQKLFDHAHEQLNAGLTLASADEGGAADLVENRGRALFA